ncbi:DUF1134 domain-containing protein [Emcibacter nanhaiensis]|uniref:DUF1134 domain-containing protein n=1 Tax=Emcibacter nanhaiensis TaxID=1505037 RepID=A0A501PBE3_9PROT|nr:DUF1134 domain-containing protein [Emcibacter nanhaiensis]TPD57518.1 DUF1134 domain-containing protein [Emcibacter nanhaiensis]
MSKVLNLFLVISGLFLAGCASSGQGDEPVDGSKYRQDQDGTNYANTYDEKSIMNAASDFLGGGSEALAKLIEKAFKDHGRPNAYIIGTEGSGALVVGLRYGDGTLSHKVEGDSRIYWTGPSIGLDVGGNASRVFALVYNLYDVQEVYQRFPAIEGSFYYIGGLGMNYQQRGDIIIAPIRVGVGLRAGANLGYMNMTKDRTWLPF